MCFYMPDFKCTWSQDEATSPSFESQWRSVSRTNQGSHTSNTPSFTLHARLQEQILARATEETLDFGMGQALQWCRAGLRDSP